MFSLVFANQSFASVLKWFFYETLKLKNKLIPIIFFVQYVGFCTFHFSITKLIFFTRRENPHQIGGSIPSQVSAKVLLSKAEFFL